MVTSFVLPPTPLYEHLTSLYKSTSLRLIEGGGGSGTGELACLNYFTTFHKPSHITPSVGLNSIPILDFECFSFIYPLSFDVTAFLKC